MLTAHWRPWAAIVLLLRLADAAAVIGRPDMVTRIDLKLVPGADRAQVQERVGQFPRRPSERAASRRQR